jgi:hypothetical protein
MARRTLGGISGLGSCWTLANFIPNHQLLALIFTVLNRIQPYLLISDIETHDVGRASFAGAFIESRLNRYTTISSARASIFSASTSSPKKYHFRAVSVPLSNTPSSPNTCTTTICSGFSTIGFSSAWWDVLLFRMFEIYPCTNIHLRFRVHHWGEYCRLGRGRLSTSISRAIFEYI